MYGLEVVTIRRQRRIIVIVIIIIAVMMLIGVGYATLIGKDLSIDGIAVAKAREFKVYYTGEVIKEEASEKYIRIESSPVALSREATVNILGLAKKDDYAYTILEIKNDSQLDDTLTIDVDVDVPTFQGNTELFQVDVLMCDENGNEISNYDVENGQKTYVKLYAKLLQTPTEYTDATITAKIKAKKKVPIEDEPGYVDYYVCKGQVINCINKINWTKPRAIIVNKSSTLGESINNALQYWYILVVVPTSDGKYTIQDIKYPYSGSDTNVINERKATAIPENGFLLGVYDPQFEVNEINLSNNEIIVNLYNGRTIASCVSTSIAGADDIYGRFYIISGKQKYIDTSVLGLASINCEDDFLYCYYDKAERKLAGMTLQEKIAQMYVVGASKDAFTSLAQYKFGGYLFFADYFENKTITTVTSDIANLQIAIKNAGGIPLITSIDEEGYTVSRLRASGFLAKNKLPEFQNSATLYNQDNANNTSNVSIWTSIEQDVWEKSTLLAQLGLNVNFAPDVDIASSGSYMYGRTLQKNAKITAEYASRVIQATKKNKDVSYCLKHFPGYGNSVDTHGSPADDNRPLSTFESKDLLPFVSGINTGAEFIMVTHNKVICMDENYPASISANVHNYLRNTMGYTNIIITDALNMGAIHSMYTSKDAIIKAINAGNDMICISLNPSGQKDAVLTNGSYETLTYQKLINYVVEAVNNNQIDETTINLAVRRILAWKYYMKLL